MAAAAYAALLSLFNNLELIQTHPRHSFSFDEKQIQSLLQIVCFLIDFMETGDYHGGSKRAAGDLEMRIASAAHAAEDVIESHVVDQIHAGSTLDGKKRSRFLLDVQKVTENMEFVRRKAIKVGKAQSGFKSNRPTRSAVTSSTPLRSSSEKDKMVGFDDILSQLLDLLTGNPSSRQIIPIVGTGGIGKTMLAKNAFQHAVIVEHFHICLWVTISQQYAVSDILLKLLSRDENPNSESVSELGKKLHQSLYGRRYLIVLDDMWSEEPWNMIKRFFPDTRCGSRIIVTSRQPLSLGSLSLAMSFMKKDASWDLFCQKVFAEQSCPLELEKAGKKIVEKCKGLPLAIVVVAGHFRASPRTQEYWENATNHMKSILDSGENQLFDILYLSYGYLPVHLKPCFLYMGVFQEDYVISVSDLVGLWIGEGFLKPNIDQTLEEVGEDCLNDLISRNMILVDRWSLNRKVKTCKMHDALRDLGLKIVEKEKLFCTFETSRSVERERRIVLNPNEIEHVLRSGPLIRSQIAWDYDFPGLFSSKLLRVVAMKDKAGEIENILRRVNLRFIRGSFELNSSISLLWNLQALIVRGHRLTTAPYEIWEMTQLRHLECGEVLLPDPPPSDEANDMILQKLETLKCVFNLRFSDEVCKRISNVKELDVGYSNSRAEYCDEPRSYCPHNLDRLHRLETLYCSIYPQGREWKEFALALTFPISLKELSLWKVQIDWEETLTKIGSLPLLEILKLGKVKGGAEWNPVEGGFPCLRYLGICFCDDLKNWNVERGHFPVLEELYLYSVRMLGELTCGIGEIPTLERIHLLKCSVSLGISAMRIMVEQEENGNDNLQLHLQFQNKRDVESFNKIVQEEGLTTNNLNLRSY